MVDGSFATLWWPGDGLWWLVVWERDKLVVVAGGSLVWHSI
jgi:hypothetical protein